MSDPLLWNLEEAARQLGGVSVRTLERLISDGELPVIYIRKRRMLEVALVRQWLATQNETAKARMEKRPCQEKTATASINNRGRRTGTEVIPMRAGDAAAAVQERITKLRRGRS